MPRASQGEVKYWLQDHDTDYINQAPPVQNTWYEVFHAYDVRLIWCAIMQFNDELAAKDVEVKWTCDGNVYFDDPSIDDNTQYYVYRNKYPSSEGEKGLSTGTDIFNAAYYVDKRALDFKVEVRMTSVPGTNQVLRCWCVRETLEQT